MFEQAVREVKQKKVCFVDDGITLRHAAKNFLQQPHCSVDYFPSPGGALEDFVNNQYDLLIVDVAVPAKANKLIRSVRQKAGMHGHILPIIIISVTSEVGIYEKALLGGPGKVVLKPYTDETLQNAMLALTSKLTPLGAFDSVSGNKNVVGMGRHVESVTQQQFSGFVSMPTLEVPVLTSMIELSHQDVGEEAGIGVHRERSRMKKNEPKKFKRIDIALDEEDVDVPPLSMMESIQQVAEKNNYQVEEEKISRNPIAEKIVKPINTEPETIFDSLHRAESIVDPIPSGSGIERTFFDTPKKEKIEPLKKLKQKKVEPLKKPKQENSSVRLDPLNSMEKSTSRGFLSTVLRFMLVLVLFASGGTYWYLDQLPVEVGVVTTQQAPIYSDISVPGRVLSKRNITISARSAGQVMTVDVNEGDTVNKGEILVRIDDKEAKNDVKLIKARLISSQADVAAAGKTYKRLRSALEFGAVTRRIVDDAEAAWKFVSAKQTEIEQELIGAEVRLDRLHIKAPFGGVVDSIFIQAGQWLFLAENVLTIIDVSQRVVDIPVDVNHSVRLNIGQEVTLSSEDFNGESWKEKIVKIGEDVKPEGSLSFVKVQVSLGRSLRIGQQVDAEIRVASKNNALLLPHYVLFVHNGSPHVAVVEKGKVAFIPVVTGIEDVKQVEIVKGLHVGQAVVDPRGVRLEIGMSAVISPS